MPKRCTICSHKRRLEIDRALVGGTPYRELVKRYGVSLGSLSRHRENHLVRVLRDAGREIARKEIEELRSLGIEGAERRAEVEEEIAEEAEAARAHAADLLGELRAIYSRTVRILEKAEEDGESGTALRAIRECRGTLELLAKMVGELEDGVHLNVALVESPEWGRVRTALLDALQGHPEAREAAARRLLALGAGG